MATESDILFDTWAWWEVLHATAKGRHLARRYLEQPGVRLHTSALTIGEVAARLHAGGAAARVSETVAAIRAFSQLHDVTADLAQEAGRVRKELREARPRAGLADAIILTTARVLDAILITADEALTGRPGVRDD